VICRVPPLEGGVLGGSSNHEGWEGELVEAEAKGTPGRLGIAGVGVHREEDLSSVRQTLNNRNKRVCTSSRSSASPSYKRENKGQRRDKKEMQRCEELG